MSWKIEENKVNASCSKSWAFGNKCQSSLKENSENLFSSNGRLKWADSEDLIIEIFQWFNQKIKVSHTNEVFESVRVLKDVELEVDEVTVNFDVGSLYTIMGIYDSLLLFMSDTSSGEWNFLAPSEIIRGTIVSVTNMNHMQTWSIQKKHMVWPWDRPYTHYIKQFPILGWI